MVIAVSSQIFLLEDRTTDRRNDQSVPPFQYRKVTVNKKKCSHQYAVPKRQRKKFKRNETKLKCMRRSCRKTFTVYDTPPAELATYGLLESGKITLLAIFKKGKKFDRKRKKEH